MAFDRSKCQGCPVDGMYHPTEPVGAEDARYLVITDTPSQAGAKEGRLLAPGAARVFGQKMSEAGFTRDDFRFYPACRCAVPENDYTNREKSKITKHCRAHFLDEVDELQPEAIIPLGAPATSQVFGRSVKITHHRGLTNTVQDLAAPVFPIIAPSIVVAYPQNEPLFTADVQSFARFVDFNYDAASASVEHGTYTLVDDLQFLLDQEFDLLSFDLETTGTRWYQPGVDVRTYNPAVHKGNPEFKPRFQILTMQFSVRTGESFVLVWDHPEKPIAEHLKPRIRNQLRRLLCDREHLVGGHNDKFDNVGFWKTEGIRYRISWDTLLGVAMLDENAPEKNLDVMTKIHVPEMAGYADEFNRTTDKSRMWEVPIDKIRGYGGGDTDAALRLWLKIEPELMSDERQWSNYCNVGIPGLNALAAMETRGMYVDTDNELPTFQAYMEEEVSKAYDSLLRQIPRAVRRDHVDAQKGNVEKALSFGRKDFLRDVLFDHPNGFRLKPKVFTKSTRNLNDKNLWIPSTSSKDHLPYFFEECPFTFELAEYVKDERLLSTNIISFNEKYVVGGKVRPTYSLTTAVTGRTASQDPNGQNYPKRSAKSKMYRKMFTAPPGYYVCELDLSQAELRIAASMARDPTMLEIYRNNGDIHTATALIVLGMTMEQFRELPKAEQKLARTKAKSVNFGFLYGMGWRNFIVFAKTQYNVEFTEAEAKNIRAGFFKKYNRLTLWHERMRAFAQANKFVRSFSGRIRHLPMIDSEEEYIRREAERQAINSPVQEFGSSLGVMALGRMDEEIDPEYLQIVGFIHDAIVVYVKKEYLDWGMKTVKWFMESNPIQEWFGSEVLCPIVADAGFGENLGEVHECEGFSLDEPFDYGSLRDKDGNLLIEVPEQLTPPNNGRLARSAYTTPEDLEPEAIQQSTRRVMRQIRRGPDPAPRTAAADPAVPRHTRRIRRNVTQ